jgi:hypothetical protein
VYYKTLARVDNDPLPVAAHGNFGPEIIDYYDIMMYIILSLYSPLAFPLVAKMVNSLSQGNGTFMAEVKRMSLPLFCPSPYCAENPWSQDCFSNLVCMLIL